MKNVLCEIALVLFETGSFAEFLFPHEASPFAQLSFMLTENSLAHFTIQGDF